MEKTQAIEQELSDLRRTAEAIEYAYMDLCSRNDPRRDQLPMSFFRALAKLTLVKAQDGVSLIDVRFTTTELAQKVIELGYVRKQPKDIGPDWVRANWIKLEKEIESRKDYLQEISRELNVDFYPWIGKEESIGGQGNYSYYYLTAKHFNEYENTELRRYDCAEDSIHYIQESLSDIPRWARWINGFTLDSWKRYAFVLPGMIILLLLLADILLTLLLGIYTNISTVKWITFLIVSGGMFWAFFTSPLFSVPTTKIVMAPSWMVPLKETNAQLEIKKIGTNAETGYAIRELRLVVYSAKCPICDGRIEVQSGGIQFPFRLVGKCNESPREHVFSFDHVTRTGKPLLK